jgi:adenosylmethionine-8-amino-7-oxononanoate aminotransferase
VCEHARGEGLLLRPLGNVLVIMPPLAITLDQLDRIAVVVDRAIPAVTEA